MTAAAASWAGTASAARTEAWPDAVSIDQTVAVVRSIVSRPPAMRRRPFTSAAASRDRGAGRRQAAGVATSVVVLARFTVVDVVDVEAAACRPPCEELVQAVAATSPRTTIAVADARCIGRARYRSAAACSERQPC